MERLGMRVANEVLDELYRAMDKFAPFNSAHEGYAVILEEMDELWDAIKNNKLGTEIEQRAEAIQVAAMAFRFVMDVSDKRVLDSP